MKKKMFVYAVLVSVVTLFSFTGLYAENKLNAEVGAKLEVFSQYLLEHNTPTGVDCKEGFYPLIEAMVLMLPQAGYSTEFNDKITKANELFKKNGIFERQGIELLHQAYRSINNGKDFEIPGDLKEISDAVEYGKKWVNLSRECLKQGKTGDAVRHLLDVAIMVVTPMEKVEKR